MKNPLLRYRNIIRADERRRNIQKYKATISGVAKRILREEYGGHAPKHGWRPPGVTVLDDDALPSGTPDGKHYRTINMRYGITATDDGDRVDIDAQGDGLGPYWYDYLVDDDWATQVSNGEIVQGAAASEGQSLTTFHGHVFKVYSTIQGAIDDAVSDNQNQHYSIGIVQGSYDENIDWPETADASNIQAIDLVGLGSRFEPGGTPSQNQVDITPSSGSCLTYLGGSLGINAISGSFTNIAFVTSASAAIFSFGAQSTSATFAFVECYFDGGDVELVGDFISFNACHFSSTASVVGDSVADVDDVEFTSCYFLGNSLSLGTNAVAGLRVAGNSFVNAAINIGDGTDIVIDSNIFSSFTNLDNVIVGTPGAGGRSERISIVGNVFQGGPPSTTNACIVLGDISNECHGISIVGNTFAGNNGTAVAATTAWMKLTGASANKVHNVVVADNDFGTSTTETQSIEANGGYSIIADYLERSVIGPNSPVGLVQYNITNGANNLIIPSSADANGSADSGAIPISSAETLPVHTHADSTEGGTISHSDLDDLTAPDDHTQYALLAGRSGGQTLIGGTDASDDLTLQATSHATPGQIVLDDDVIISNNFGIVVGHTSQLTVNAIVPEFQVVGNSTNDAGMSFSMFDAAGTDAPELYFVTSRNATPGSHTIVSNNNEIGGLAFFPDDGVDYDTLAARFTANVDDASPAAGDIGMKFNWELMPGGGGALRTVMDLDAKGNLYLDDTGSYYAQEKSAADTDFAGYGQDWVRSDTPNTKWFTDDAGNDILVARLYSDIRYFSVQVFAPGNEVVTGTGKAFFHIPPGLNGMNLVYVHGEVFTAGTGTGTDTSAFDVNNNGSSMLSTTLTIDEDETGSDTAATSVSINTSADDVATNDVISIDVDSVTPTTAPIGLIITLGFQLP